MTKISTIILPLYNKLLPICEPKKITLNLDFPDPTIQTSSPEILQNSLKNFIKSAIQRIGKNGDITISITQSPSGITQLAITDTGIALTKSEVAAQATDTTTIRSRLGYGTTVTVKIPT